jgi:hypothetical protein
MIPELITLVTIRLALICIFLLTMIQSLTQFLSHNNVIKKTLGLFKSVSNELLFK